MYKDVHYSTFCKKKLIVYRRIDSIAVYSYDGILCSSENELMLCVSTWLTLKNGMCKKYNAEQLLTHYA